ncbi:hypothetical protein HMPREF1550_00347 [Actinomyces sp. oral taxon 877 str. F0543]|nr:hypothetical protein HMPREF1550_00347 [Actinomyces sp. oral taxon 877 str. F0543]
MCSWRTSLVAAAGGAGTAGVGADTVFRSSEGLPFLSQSVVV